MYCIYVLKIKLNSVRFKMLIYLFLFFTIFSFSFQGIPTGIFCDDYLRGVYVLEGGKGGTLRKISSGWDGNAATPYVYTSLDVAPGDYVRFTCYNYIGGYSFGAACFYIYNKCYCYDFEVSNKPQSSRSESKSVTLNNVKCSMVLHTLQEYDKKLNYNYEHYIPLDATELKCQNNNNVLIYLNGVDYSLKLSNYISSAYSIKNVEISITQNYGYFKLNNIALVANQRFNVESQITFNSNVAQKIYVKFRNYGKILSGTRDCGFYIRVCHQSCSECTDEDITNDNYRCKKCKSNYYFVQGTTKCVTKQEMQGTNYYFDTTGNVFKKCYTDCHTCSAGGNASDMKCSTCSGSKPYLAEPHNCITDITHYYYDSTQKIYKKCYTDCNTCSGAGNANDMKCSTCSGSKPYLAEPHNCIADITHYYYSKEDNIYKKCYKSCYSCDAKSIEGYHNCTKCEESYHYVYNEISRRNCIHESTKPSNTYLDTESNTYELCYERCSSCSQKGDIVNNNCDECAKDDNGNYLYHYDHNKPGQCIAEKEKPSNTYLDTETNTYKLCYERCSLCDIGGDNTNNNCKECLKDDNNNYIYHFIHDKEGICLSEAEKPLNTYLDLETNTYELCYEKCSSCDKHGDINNNNCKTCLKDQNGNYIYHFIFNREGQCVDEKETFSNSYLDIDTNTFRLCYERCSLCNKGGNETNNNCEECSKDENNTFLYHFIFNETGRCIKNTEKPLNTYLDTDDNTYKLCYERCSSCDIKGNDINNNCNECAKDENNTYMYHFIHNETGKCLDETEKPSNTYLDTETNTYKLCYERCSSCEIKSDSTDNNCNECLRDENNTFLYHFVYIKPGQCVTEKEKPSNTYLDTDDNTYKLCYERCSSCDIKGNDINNNCNECAKDENNTYMYHFIHNKRGKCLSETERPLNTYLNTTTNTYELCYERCDRCESYPECSSCLKDEKNNFIYHFISDEKGKCFEESEIKSEIKDGFFYLDNNDNTYKKCPEGTIRVENNECIEDNIETILLASIISLIIILVLSVPLFFWCRSLYRKKKIDKEISEMIYH